MDNSIATNKSIHRDLINFYANFCNSAIDLTILVILIWSQKEEKAVLWFASSGKYIFCTTHTDWYYGIIGII